jgi:membrane-bound serine protease (ClpP class)
MLIILGVGLLVIDAHVITHGALTVSGLISLAIGMIMLFHNAPAPYHTSLPLVLSITVALGAFWAFALTKAVQVRRRPVIVGPNRVVGSEAVVRTPGQVFVAGELWRARREDGAQLVPGEHVRVTNVRGLELTVE